MKGYALFVLAIALLTSGCLKQNTYLTNPSLKMGGVALKFDRASAPRNISAVIAYLSRAGYDTLTSQLNIQTDSTAGILFQDVPSGQWHLVVNALNNTAVTAYTGQTDVEVNAGTTTQIDLALVPTNQGTGNIDIVVHWGNSNDSFVALWHFDESSGTIVNDGSPYGNNGIAVGTTIIPGRFSNARSFNGAGDYVYVPEPANGSIDFGQNQSFTIDLWFKTTSDTLQDMIRKGSAPIPGFFIQTWHGNINAGIGADVNSPPPDTVLSIISDQKYNDGQWHEVRLIRDRQIQKLLLYVDGVQATAPINEPIPLFIANNHILTIGRWENSEYPLYFTGAIDEITVWNKAVYP